MIRNATRAIVVMALLLGIGAVDGGVMSANSGNELPIQVLEVRIPTFATDQLVDRIRNFAETYAFAIRVSQSSPDPNNIFVQMWREDIKLIGSNVSDTGASDITFKTFFYKICDRPISAEIVDQLVGGLKRIIGEVEGITFSEEK